MQLNPGEHFVITHQIGDHTDSTTYYVQAVVRNARTDATIATVNLTDRGSQRFSEEWQVPQDPSGQGFYISITTTVYTDSNYSAKSALYSEEQERLLIQTRPNPNLGYGGGGGGHIGGDEVNYKKIKKIVKEEIAQIKFPKQKEVKIPPLDLTPVQESFKAQNARIEELYDDLKMLMQEIDEMPRFEKPTVDLGEVMSQFKIIANEASNIETLVAKMDGMAKDRFQTEKKLERLASIIVSAVSSLNEKSAGLPDKGVDLEVINPVDTEEKPEKPARPEQYTPDLSKLARRSQIRRAKSNK
jgi:hypothetical protein